MKVKKLTINIFSIKLTCFLNNSEPSLANTYSYLTWLNKDAVLRAWINDSEVSVLAEVSWIGDVDRLEFAVVIVFVSKLPLVSLVRCCIVTVNGHLIVIVFAIIRQN